MSEARTLYEVTGDIRDLNTLLVPLTEIRRLSAVEDAWTVWQQKTEWVQESAQPHELGLHRADVLRGRIDTLIDAATKGGAA